MNENVIPVKTGIEKGLSLNNPKNPLNPSLSFLEGLKGQTLSSL